MLETRFNRDARVPERSTAAVDPLGAAQLRLESVIDRYGSVAVAFSGGIDSTLVLKVCRDRLQDRAVGVIGVSPSLPPGELDDARALAGSIGVTLVEIETREFDDPNYRSNPVNRCYFCKGELYRLVVPYAREHGLAVVADGLNVDDRGEHRPGVAAADENDVRHPLLEAGLDKAAIRALARRLGLANWDKPALACLSSRVPHGTPVSAPLLEQVGAAESALRRLGFRVVRVRHHGDVARIELGADEIERAVSMREEIVARVRAAGYRFVALDLVGYKSGSLHGLQAPPGRV